MQDRNTISGAIVKRWFDVLVGQGIAQEVLEAKTALDYQQLADLDARIPLQQHFTLMDVGIQLTGDPALALHIGETFSPEKLGVVGYVFMNCPTLRDAGYQVIRYSKLICESAYLDLQEKDDHAILIEMLEEPEYDSRASAEVSLTSAITMVRVFTGKPINPLEVRFQHAPPDHLAEYERIFQAPLLFNQPENMMIFDRSILDSQLASHNPYLHEILIKHADELLEQLNAQEQLQDQVQNFIFNHLPTGDVDIEMVADHLNMSRWTLTRKLKEEGTSFQDLFKQMRKTMAMKYLQRSQFFISEVAFLLGFSEPSTFHRAFKSWAGQSPGEYRKSCPPLSAAS